MLMVRSDVVDIAQEGVVRLCGRAVDIVMFREISMKRQEQNTRHEYAALNLDVFKWCTPVGKLYFGNVEHIQILTPARCYLNKT